MNNKSNRTNTVIKSAIIKNPVLFEAIGIAPVVAMATSLKTSFMLTAITVVQMIITELLACKFLKFLKSRFRVMLYAVTGVLINIPMFSIFNHFAPNETANVSIFLPIIAVNSLIALHCERFAVKHNLKEALIDAVSSSFGYGLIVMLVGLIREIFGSGTVYGHDIGLKIKFSGLLLPFGGFLLLGYTSALLKRLIKKSYPDENPETAFNLSEISQSHFDSIKNLFTDDFNPFDEEFELEAATVHKEKSSSKDEEKEKHKKPSRLPKIKRSKKEKFKEKTDIKIDRKENIIDTSDSIRSLDETTENILSNDKKYESEFDDLLFELENRKNNSNSFNGKDGENE